MGDRVCSFGISTTVSKRYFTPFTSLPSDNNLQELKYCLASELKWLAVYNINYHNNTHSVFYIFRLLCWGIATLTSDFFISRLFFVHNPLKPEEPGICAMLV